MGGGVKWTGVRGQISKRKELLSIFRRNNVVAMLGGHTHGLHLNEKDGIKLVNGETTSDNWDGRPVGFRLWHVDREKQFRHEFVPLDGF